ncbi:MAG: four helix bundle protein [Bacteroidales bacterium]|nr:four helix bundle protein [Bacteroidales bacterium]
MIHKKLDVYKLAVKFVGKIYNLSGSFPKDERYGITSQIRRAAVSIPLNIAEGSSRKSIKELSIDLYRIRKMLQAMINKKRSTQ